jgi:hypothetical protein
MSRGWMSAPRTRMAAGDSDITPNYYEQRKTWRNINFAVCLEPREVGSLRAAYECIQPHWCAMPLTGYAG